VFPVVGDDGRLIGMAFRPTSSARRGHELVLVDHNELAQAVNGAEEAEIVEVLDHHRLGGGLKSTQPIRFVNEPVGSTCTLVARQFRAAGIVPAPAIALCMASGIISDTLLLRSPTTTDVDREVLCWLAGLCGVDLDGYAKDFFEIGSALRSKAPADVIREDCKEFPNTVCGSRSRRSRRLALIFSGNGKTNSAGALEAFAEKQRLDFPRLLRDGCRQQWVAALVEGVRRRSKTSTTPRLDRSLYALANVVSRKKQLLPLIAQMLSGEKFQAGLQAGVV